MSKENSKYDMVDGNTAASHVAYAYTEVAAIYPITPSSVMSENADVWATEGRKNIFGEPVRVVEMQSEGGVAGAVHGSLTTGSLTTTFTSSQGLLLMLPNMFKMSGELLPAVFHVAARSLAYHSLSIFGDHSDVMAARTTGFAMLASNSVQEAHDMAIVTHLSALESSVPFVHFFDGFRISSEIQKVELADYDTLKSLLDTTAVKKFRDRALLPEHPFSKIGNQNPDVYFQGRERQNEYYDRIPAIVKKNMELVSKTFGRNYKLYEYYGHPEADRVIVSMGSSCETIEETIDYLNAQGQKLGLVKVRLYRPLFVEDFVSVVPATVKKIAVLDRTKESGSLGEPLYLDVVAALKDRKVKIYGGRYGLSSKEFTPSMVKAVYDHIKGSKAFHGFSVGIEDDVTHKSLKVKEKINTESKGVVRCKFWGYGSDGTVGANKNSIKIIGDNTEMYAQGYFEYDSKKCGGITVSHLRFGKEKIKSHYLLTEADFVAVHKFAYMNMYDVLAGIAEGGTLLLNTAFDEKEIFSKLPVKVQKTIIEKKLKFYIIDATKIAKDVGLPGRVNTVMQTAFFSVSGVLAQDKALGLIKEYTKKTYIKKGQEVVDLNIKAIDGTVSAMKLVALPEKTVKYTGPVARKLGENVPAFVRDVLLPVSARGGNDLPVSKMTIDGAVPLGTTKYEKRGIAEEVPDWISEKCIQCAMCSFVCPHAAIRVKQMEPLSLTGAPKTFKTLKSMTKNDKELQFKVQVYPEDCTGCGVCVEACPVKEKAILMKPLSLAREKGENENQAFFDSLPNNVLDGAPEFTIKGSQFKEPLFEFSGACSGCGESPYIKLLTQLYGDRMIIANATGCTSIYGGTYPSIPYTANSKGYGPAWANSLFEDNAEFGFGMRVSVDTHRERLFNVIGKLVTAGVSSELTRALNTAIANWKNKDANMRATAEKIVGLLPSAIAGANDANKSLLLELDSLKDYIMDKSIWLIGGDGWAYDIGFGGLDHVLASGKNVKVLLLDTEVYSNTGGQASKSTPKGAIAKFAASGKRVGKKDLGQMMMSYGYIYVASVDMGGDKMQLLKALKEAEEYDGPAIVIAYSPCVEQGINMTFSQGEGKKAYDSGYWPLYRFDPRLSASGKNPLVVDSKDTTLGFKDFLLGENRFKALQVQFPAVAEKVFTEAENDSKKKLSLMKAKSAISYAPVEEKKE